MVTVLNSTAELLRAILNHDSNRETRCESSNETNVNQNLNTTESPPLNSKLDVRTKDGGTPLHYAATRGQTEITEICLSMGASPNAQDNIENASLHLAAAYGYSKLGRLLINCQAIVDIRNHELMTPLHTAAFRGHYQFVQLLLELGASVDARSAHQSTPLHLSSENGFVKCCESLLKYGANSAALDVQGRTPLVLASQNGSVETIQCLLGHGANTKIMNPEGGSLLHYTCLNGHLNALNLLIGRGGFVNTELNPSDMASSTLVEFVNVQDRKGKTPLHFAVQMGTKDLVLSLLEAGADLSVQDCNGWQCLHYAVHAQKIEVVRILLSRGARVNDICSRGRSALHLASVYDNEGLLQLLLGHDAQCFPDSSGWTPVDILQQYRLDLVSVLQSPSTIGGWTGPRKMKWPTRWSNSDRASDLILKNNGTIVELSGQFFIQTSRRLRARLTGARPYKMFQSQI